MYWHWCNLDDERPDQSGLFVFLSMAMFAVSRAETTDVNHGPNQKQNRRGLGHGGLGVLIARAPEAPFWPLHGLL
jgi:hypothetical protein